MAHVRGHYRNGRYVRPHTRRTKSVTQPRSSHLQPSSTGPTTGVRGHYRNGRYVRPHQRRTRTAQASGGLGVVFVVLLVLAYLNGGVPGSAQSQPPTPAGQSAGQSADALP